MATGGKKRAKIRWVFGDQRSGKSVDCPETRRAARRGLGEETSQTFVPKKK